MSIRKLILGMMLGAMHAGAHKVRAVARRLDGWLERRRLAAAAMRELAAMSDFELRDIRLSRYDVEHL